MQEQQNNKSSGDGGESRNRHPRRRGYFIEPAGKENTAQKSDKSGSDGRKNQQSPAEGKPQEQNQGKNKNNNQNKNQDKEQGKNQGNDRRQNHKPNKNNRKPRPEGKPSEAKPDVQQGSPEAEKPHTPAENPEKKKNNKNRRRNKRKSSSPRPEATADSAVATNSRPNPPQKSGRFQPIMREKKATDHSEDDYEEYKLVVDDATDAGGAPAANGEDAPKTEVVGVRFKSSGKVYYFDPKGKTYKKGSHAIVDTARGTEFGEVAMENSFIKASEVILPLREVIRQATDADVEHHKANKAKEEDAFKICNEKIAAHKLDMKLIEAQYTFDNSKLLFYFTSSDRVDFRALVKDLAAVFHTRIELRQIGIRDEAKLMGGLGMCGRPLCCNLFLNDFDQVSIKMAKEQNLSLNSAKISGICGRLMCCLKFEHEAYEYEIKRTPPVDSLVRTEDGDGVVTEINPLQGMIKVKLLASPDVPPKSYHRDNVKMLRKKQGADKKGDKN